MVHKRSTPMDIYHQMIRAYGPQGWWPAATAFEMMIGAILTQNTSWTHVEKAIANLREAHLLEAKALLESDEEEVATLIRPSGFYRQKAARLRELARFYLNHGGVEGLKRWPITTLRHRLLEVHGIGPETADSILLYGLEKPIFVVDAYTKRVFHRLGILPEELEEYSEVQRFIQTRVANTLSLYKEFHALIVEHAKRHCHATPQCKGECPLSNHCRHRQQGHMAIPLRESAPILAETA